MNGIVLSSRVRLARNYQDIPFRTRMNKEQAAACVERTLSALRDLPEPYRFVPMNAADSLTRQSLVESHLISPDLFAQDDLGAVLLREDQRVSVMMNEEDHLRIQAFQPGHDLNGAAQNAYLIEDALQRHLSFAFDNQLGYLTACPTNTGTGMRASVMLHLPMLTLFKQMGKVNQLAAKLGLTLRGIYGEGSEAQGNVYQLSNQVTLGRTENEIIEAVSAVARQLAEMEKVFRDKTMETDAVAFEDQLFRSLGLMKNARRMGGKEFMAHWSNLRLGADMGVLPVTVNTCDGLLTACQSAHLQKNAGRQMDDKALDQHRSDLIREKLQDGGCD